MKSKQLEALLAEEMKIGEAEMVQRFQKLRDNNMLSRSRGRNAELLSSSDIVSGILGCVAERPGYAGMMTIVLRGLRAVGTVDHAFAKAEGFAGALKAMLDDKALLDTVLEVRISDSEVYTNSSGRASITYRGADGSERTTYYVRKEAVSLLQPGAEKTYNPRDLITSMIREVVIFPRILKTIVAKKKAAEAYEKAMSAPASA